MYIAGTKWRAGGIMSRMEHLYEWEEEEAEECAPLGARGYCASSARNPL